MTDTNASARGSAISVVLVGGGRMGALIASTMEAQGGFDILGVYDENNIDELDAAAPVADLAVDFSNKAALPHVCAYVRRSGCALVSGTTGYTADELNELRALGDASAVIHSANYSLGVAVLRRLAAEAARALADFDIRDRRDAPQPEGRRPVRHRQHPALGGGSRGREERGLRARGHGRGPARSRDRHAQPARRHRRRHA